MGAVEHLKTLCCLGLPPESSMIAVTPLLHEIFPHGAARTVLFEPDPVRAAYAENPATTAIWLEHASRFMNDRTSPCPYGFLGSVPRASAGFCICKAEAGWSAAGTGTWRRRLIPAGFWMP